MEKISTTIITYNEEENIEDCLKSVVSFSDEIIVVDSFSTDNTVKIAEQYTDKVYKQKFLGHVQQKNFAVSKAAYNWIFAIDADERASALLQEKILKLKTQGFAVSAYYVNRKNYYITDWMTAGGWYPDKKIRLFHKDRAVWSGENPHDYVLVQSGNSIGRIHADLLHYTYRTLSAHLQQIDKFSLIAGKEKLKKSKKNVVLHLIFNPVLKFIKTYFLQRAFLKGTRGLIFSVMAAFSVFMKYAKLWELQREQKRK